MSVAGLLAKLTSIRAAVWIGVLIGLIGPVFLWPLRKVSVMPEPHASMELTHR